MEKRLTLSELFDAPIEQMDEDQLRSHIARLAEVRKKDFAQIAEDEALGRSEYRGFLYVLSNSSMPGLVKVGITSGLVKDRAKNLSRHTSVPERFVVECFFPIYEDLRRVETRVHNLLDVYRTNASREFFKIDVEQVEKVIQNLLGQKPRRLQLE